MAAPVAPKAAPSYWSRTRIAAAAGIILTILLAAIALWLAYRPFADSGGSSIAQRHDSTHTAAVMASFDSMRKSSAGDTTPVVAAPPVPAVLNPSDSAGAAAFAVQLVVINTQAGAILKLQTERSDLPAATFTPTMTPSGQWFEFVSGALDNQKDADSLFADLRRRRMLLDGSKVVRRPFAFLIDSGRPMAAVPGMIAAYVDRGQPVYALRQSNGTAWLLMGAYETPEKAASYVESLRASGITPVLVYRKGRAF